LTIINFSAKSIIIAQNNRSPFPALSEKEIGNHPENDKKPHLFPVLPFTGGKKPHRRAGKTIFFGKFSVFFRLFCHIQVRNKKPHSGYLIKNRVQNTKPRRTGIFPAAVVIIKRKIT